MSEVKGYGIKLSREKEVILEQQQKIDELQKENERYKEALGEADSLLSDIASEDLGDGDYFSGLIGEWQEKYKIELSQEKK